MRSYKALQVGKILENSQPHYNTYRMTIKKANPCEMQGMHGKDKAHLNAWVGQEAFSGKKKKVIKRISLHKPCSTATKIPGICKMFQNILIEKHPLLSILFPNYSKAKHTALFPSQLFRYGNKTIFWQRNVFTGKPHTAVKAPS